MLILTPNATMLISTLTDNPELPAGAGLRIASTDDASQPLAVSTAAVPFEADQVIDQEGARVFLDATAAQILDDKVLDAQLTDEGEIQFLIANQ